MIVCDTGPIVALSNHRDECHFAANNLFRDLHMAGETLLLPPTVLAEVCYWLNEHGGPDLEAASLDSVVGGTFQLVDLTPEDVERMAGLVRQFSSFPLGGTDASVVAPSAWERARLRRSTVGTSRRSRRRTAATSLCCPRLFRK